MRITGPRQIRYGDTNPFRTLTDVSVRLRTEERAVVALGSGRYVFEVAR
jgi:hypothetical protein